MNPVPGVTENLLTILNSFEDDEEVRALDIAYAILNFDGAYYSTMQSSGAHSSPAPRPDDPNLDVRTTREWLSKEPRSKLRGIHMSKRS